ncbi:GAL3ST1 [Mytilus edulis]|uniref:GAL3ST1 n=1 Tax=Mytilus edulis TaxID=6550 RepID=A0A8S3UHM1_MYTED|nr:GAL3ST1 [Mytilus edulis]
MDISPVACGSFKALKFFLLTLLVVCVIFISLPFIGKHSTVIFYEAAFYNVSVEKNTHRYSSLGYPEDSNIKTSKKQIKFRSVDIETTTTQITTTKQIDVYTEKLSTEAFSELLGPHSINIGIVRDPFTQFPSAAYYYGLLSRIKKRFGNIKKAEELLSRFLKAPDAFGSILHIHNGMFSDFGLPKKDFHNEEAINKRITDLDKEFALVMVTELFDESLILMRRILCWGIKDILYVPLNINKNKKQHPIVLSEDTKQNLFKYNYADFKLYIHFRDKMIEQIKDQGQDFYSEVRYFKKFM